MNGNAYENKMTKDEDDLDLDNKIYHGRNMDFGCRKSDPHITWHP